MKPLLTHRAPYAWEYVREHTCNKWRLVALGTALATGWLHAQVQTPASSVPLALPTPISVQAASAVPLPVLGTLILSPLERRQLDAASQLVTNGQGSFLAPGSQGRTTAPLEAPMFWINRRPPDGASAGGALRALSGNFDGVSSDTKNAISGAKPDQAVQNPSASLPPGAITIIPPLVAASDGAKAIGKKEK